MSMAVGSRLLAADFCARAVVEKEAARGLAVFNA